MAEPAVVRLIRSGTLFTSVHPEQRNCPPSSKQGSAKLVCIHVTNGLNSASKETSESTCGTVKESGAVETTVEVSEPGDARGSPSNSMFPVPSIMPLMKILREEVVVVLGDNWEF